MALQFIKTEQAPAAIGPYSQGVQAGPFLFVSGQIGLDPATGQMVSDEFEEQVKQVLKNLGRVVQAGGCRIEDIAVVDVFLTDIARFGAFNELYEAFFGTHKPARAVVEVNSLPRGALVEVKCVTYKAA
ncbi:MAG: Rid family detoxifying hydrolase [Syntrophobacteraceae bacterium]